MDHRRAKVQEVVLSFAQTQTETEEAKSGFGLMVNVMKPDELDKQCPIKIDGWIDIGSDKWKELDDTPDFTKMCLAIGLGDGFFFLDSLGRVWGRPTEYASQYIPFHFEVGTLVYGYRLPQKAAN